ncbi:uncharacterized protein LOC132205194 [Neocloeon triangulifer]|uniref:uncharacterized protein LOC132205194 n=1 Tax=Neocloeon triangulifer TaxID=2078957 RepID=UPI00286F4970|nr:uncharacterized protein LOC132205194 [Neocloeon triangulifer]
MQCLCDDQCATAMKKKLAFFVLAFTAVTILAARKGGHKAAGAKNGIDKRSRKNMIVKCCGQTSCTKINATRRMTMVKNSSKILSPSNTMALSTNSLDNNGEDQFLPTDTTMENLEVSMVATDELINTETTSTVDTSTTTSAATELSTPSSSSSTVTPTALLLTTSTNSIYATSTFTSSTSTSSASTTSTSTSSTTTSTTSTTTTSSTSSTTSTTTTTTTKPPTKEELILGTCDTSFKQDKNLLNTGGTLKEPEKYGFWVQSCGQQFLFGKSLSTWRENFIKCYQIGMEPLTFENSSKLECFSTLVSKWKYSSNYWTSGLRVNISAFSWCTKNGSLAVDSTKLPWAPGQPQNYNNSENCLHLNVTKATATFQFSDRSCTDLQIFSCQGPPTPAPSCSSPVCPNITCTKNATLYTTQGNSQYLTNPKSFGNWFTYQGRSYLFSPPNKTATFVEAMQVCCQVGMTLLSLEYDYKYKSIVAAIKENTSSSDFFWTSGSDRGCKANFGYCTVKRLLRAEAVWAPGQPDDRDGNESGVVVFINSSNAQLFDFNEESKFRYICEARDTSRAKSGGSAVKDECASIYNVSQTEIDSLLNSTFKKDLRLKCFIKCLGENSGLMVNGKFLENEVLAILEKFAGGNLDELQKNMGIVDECGNSSNGMDECDKAAQMIKCSSEKAPDVLNGIITAMDQAMPIEKSPLEPGAYCYQPTCQVNSTLAAEVASCNGNCTTSTGYVRTLCGKRYYHHILEYNQTGAYITCCIFGLKLVSIETTEEFMCITSLSTPNSARWTWIALSRINGTKPRWCTSNAEFNFANYPYVTERPDTFLDAYVIAPDQKVLSITQQLVAQHPLCEFP